MREQLLKRKARLEDDLDKCKKKLTATEKSLKQSEDSSRDLKTAVQDCKKLGDRLIRIADKVMPPPPKKKKATEESPVCLAISLVC